MLLDQHKVANMIDLSCVRTHSNKSDIEKMVNAAITYDFSHVSVLQCFIPYTKNLLSEHPNVKIVGNVSFPSGSDSTSVKIFQAQEMIEVGCDELDMVMNIGKLRSGEFDYVSDDVRAVVDIAEYRPVKIIIEINLLSQEEIIQACEICLNCGASFIKTGSGWVGRGASVGDINLIKSIVADKIDIKASGGIRDLSTLTAMYKAGAVRFGINLKSAISIIEEFDSLEEDIKI